MAGISNEEKLRRIHADALQSFDRVQTALRNERMQCLQDRRFYSIPGAQWEGQLGEQFENRVKMEFNKVHLAVIRIISEYRNNRITADFVPKDGASNAEMADVCDGLYRADERDSGAQEAYDNGFEEAVGGGFGAWRLRACYEDEDDDDNDKQTVRIEPIFDADSSVYFDLDAKRQDKADATECWVLKSMTHAAFEEEFGHSPVTWPKIVHQRQFDWVTPDMTYVAEYYKVEKVSELVHIYRGLDGSEKSVSDAELKEEPEMARELEVTGWREVRQKKIKRRRVHKYIMSGLKVEEDEGYIAGRNIPIVPVYGKRWFVDNVERCMGHVRLAKDAQRLQNSLMSWLTEMAARFDTEKPILTPEQIRGYAQMWADDNVERYPYLLLNAMKDLDGNPIPGTNVPMAYTKAPNVPPAMAALLQVASQALEDMLGNQEAGEQLQPNISGKAVELIQSRLDMQAYIYLDNMAKAVQRSGEIWLSMKKDVTPEQERAMKSVSLDGEAGSVVVNQPYVDPDTGEQIMKNDMDDASFDVWVDVGPSSSTKRQATVKALSAMAQQTQDPELATVLNHAALMNMDGEGLQDLRNYSRMKLVRMGVIKPTDEEAQELQQEAANTPPDPQAQALQAMADQSTAQAEQARAKTVEAIASADLKRAQTAQTYAAAQSEGHERWIASAQALGKLLDSRAGQPQQPRFAS